MAKKKKQYRGYKFLEDRRMHDFGDTDFEKKRVRVNPRKGDVVDTILHEKMHINFPKMSEKVLRARVKKKISKMTLREQCRVIFDFIEKSTRKI